ncbi:hypothetical protein FA10DRAFT_253404 [Acaromyces ingoldii]|uniref:Uncharacterized protein n=1 Tax=Acaromyces ingoldii TaxID=215250 RepID=A0A316YJP9_9BASI|nr:hypothetical protein FA10DRAFT_253404 [Acaromyces ingoldii]PWN89296.1 hypothetical protein FA10DRAFT_253404 [Acaromyces ingoldii]
MGSSSSKPLRRLGKETVSSQPMGAPGVSRAAAPPSNRLTRGLPEQLHPSFSENKSHSIKQDSQDPQLMANLQKLGPVQVPRGKINFRSSNEMLNILAAREKNQNEEAQDASSTNRLSIHSILQLLDERKRCQTQRQVDELSVGFDIDRKVLDDLARLVNSPSIEQEQHVRTNELKGQDAVEVEADDDTPPRVHAVWTEPALNDVKEIPGR